MVSILWPKELPQATAIWRGQTASWIDTWENLSERANKKYIVEVKFTKDGTLLKDLNPRLVVRMIDF